MEGAPNFEKRKPNFVKKDSPKAFELEKKASRENPKALSLFDNVKSRLLSLLHMDDFDSFQEKGRDMVRFFTQSAAINALGDEAGDFFKNLIPRGIKKPDVDKKWVQSHGSGLPEMKYEFDEKLSGLQDHLFRTGMPGREYRKKRDKIFAEWLAETPFNNPPKPFNGAVVENSPASSEIEQKITRALSQAGGCNLIYEKVSNIFDPKTINLARSELIIQDIKTGVVVNLGQLLPGDCSFVPSCMVPQQDVVVDGGVAKRTNTAINLKDYVSGEHASKDYFAFGIYNKLVKYGDLTKKGAMLSLFHETAHAWQHNYIDREKNLEGRHGFEKLHKKTMELVTKLCKIIAENNPETETVESKKERKKIVSELAEMGVELVDIGNGASIVSTDSPIDQKDVINLESPNNSINRVIISYLESLLLKSSDQEEKLNLENEIQKIKKSLMYFPVKSPVLQKAIDTYIQEERDAWAHALRIMRFLRRKGLDVEPELNSLTDIQGVIASCLDSYQNSLEDVVKANEGGYRFSRAESVAKI